MSGIERSTTSRIVIEVAIVVRIRAFIVSIVAPTTRRARAANARMRQEPHSD